MTNANPPNDNDPSQPSHVQKQSQQHEEYEHHKYYIPRLFDLRHLQFPLQAGIATLAVLIFLSLNVNNENSHWLPFFILFISGVIFGIISLVMLCISCIRYPIHSQRNNHPDNEHQFLSLSSKCHNHVSLWFYVFTLAYHIIIFFWWLVVVFQLTTSSLSDGNWFQEHHSQATIMFACMCILQIMNICCLVFICRYVMYRYMYAIHLKDEQYYQLINEYRQKKEKNESSSPPVTQVNTEIHVENYELPMLMKTDDIPFTQPIETHWTIDVKIPKSDDNNPLD